MPRRKKVVCDPSLPGYVIVSPAGKELFQDECIFKCLRELRKHLKGRLFRREDNVLLSWMTGAKPEKEARVKHVEEGWVDVPVEPVDDVPTD